MALLAFCAFECAVTARSSLAAAFWPQLGMERFISWWMVPAALWMAAPYDKAARPKLRRTLR